MPEIEKNYSEVSQPKLERNETLIRQDRHTLASKKIKEIRSNPKILTNQFTPENPEQHLKEISQESHKRIQAYTEEGPNSEDWYTINYEKIDDISNNTDGSHEYGIGLGEILIDPRIKKVEVIRDGETLVGKRGVVSKGKHAGRVSFIDQNGDYLFTHTGDKFRILEISKDQSNESVLAMLQTESRQRKKFESAFQRRQIERNLRARPKNTLAKFTQSLSEKIIPRKEILKEHNEDAYNQYVEIEEIHNKFHTRYTRGNPAPENVERDYKAKIKQLSKNLQQTIDADSELREVRKNEAEELVNFAREQCEEKGIPFVAFLRIVLTESGQSQIIENKKSSSSGPLQILTSTFNGLTKGQNLKPSARFNYFTSVKVATDLIKSFNIPANLPLKEKTALIYLNYHDGKLGAKKYREFREKLATKHGLNSSQEITKFSRENTMEFRKIVKNSDLVGFQKRRIMRRATSGKRLFWESCLAIGEQAVAMNNNIEAEKIGNYRPDQIAVFGASFTVGMKRFGGLTSKHHIEEIHAVPGRSTGAVKKDLENVLTSNTKKPKVVVLVTGGLNGISPGSTRAKKLTPESLKNAVEASVEKEKQNLTEMFELAKKNDSKVVVSLSVKSLNHILTKITEGNQEKAQIIYDGILALNKWKRQQQEAGNINAVIPFNELDEIHQDFHGGYKEKTAMLIETLEKLS